MDLAIMIEGQNGLTWERWKRLVRAAEDLGFAGLYRSDHFTNGSAPDVESLEAWTSLTWLADNTTRIQFGPLVSPVSFRDPVFLARMGRDVDDLSGGRLHLGVGAGWQDREHGKFGYDLLDVDGRMNRLAEGLEVITRLLTHDDPVDFDGTYYHLKEAQLLPRPARPGGPPILVGGNGPKRTLPLAAKYASLWNAIYLPPEEFARLSGILDEELAKVNRLPADVHRSMMTGILYSKDDAALSARLAARGRTAEEFRERGAVVGPKDAAVDQLAKIAEAGCQRVMLQWLELDDMDGLEALARDVLPYFPS